MSQLSFWFGLNTYFTRDIFPFTYAKRRYNKEWYKIQLHHTKVHTFSFRFSSKQINAFTFHEE
jgi:hypothetical protein